MNGVIKLHIIIAFGQSHLQIKGLIYNYYITEKPQK